MKHKKTLHIEDIANRKNRYGIHYNNFPQPLAPLTGMYVYQSGHKTKCPSGYISDHAIYDHYIVHYIISGKGTYFYHNMPHQVQAGDLFLIKPYEKVLYQADDKDPWTYYWIGFSGPDVIKILNHCGFNQFCPIVHYKIDKNLIRIFHEIAYYNDLEFGFDYSLLSLLYQIFPILTRFNTPQNISTYNRYFIFATEYIHHHYVNSTLNVQELAHYLGIDRTYLYRIFSHFSNMSVQQYILNFRLQKAAMLLQHSQLSIKSISAQCGFDNQSYFSIAFKKHFNHSPSAYRRAHLEQ
ncbi:helix-turn-helix transcriptional regulator [Spirabiliibacterium falconis]|uniref:helix-turn-helix transcriptional regulator n=1 Tax=Spirabiliibacterium falconis TaxID=572023 RepID=UPI001AADC99C|nr:AraC family transcriptional regulator [Spirabiliibacterium falconis]MBE2894578.1 AraC family transcriptional regulator [Spirabiliibacterium falconis]